MAPAWRAGSAVRLTAWLLLAAVVTAVTGQTGPRTMTISAIFDQGGDPKHELAFKHAVQVVNRNR
jgi:hypothetical protein